MRRTKIESTARYASLTLLPSVRKCIRFSHGALVETNLLLQQASMWLLGSSICFASAAAARGAESMQISHAGDRRTRQRIVGGFSFGHPKPFSFCKKKEKRVWETVSFLGIAKRHARPIFFCRAKRKRFLYSKRKGALEDR